jgi:hypothetical protein
MTDIEITKLVAETFKEYFGEERICGKYKRESRSIEVILYTPNLTIRNERGISHEITDLYTLIEFEIDDDSNDQSKIIFKGISMKRGSLTQKEYKKKYIHSHARFNSWSSWARCCLGSGPLNQIREEYLEINEMQIMNICALIDQYQRVESVEGVPYNYIEKLNESAVTSYRSPICFDQWNGGDEGWGHKHINNEFIRYLLKKKVFDFYRHDGRYHIKGALDELILIMSYQWYLFAIEKDLPVDVFNNTTIRCEYKDYKFLRPVSNNNNDADIELGIPVKVLTFKNEPVFLELEQNNTVADNTTRFVTLYKFAPNTLYAIQVLVNLLSNEKLETAERFKDEQSISNRTGERWDIKIA